VWLLYSVATTGYRCERNPLTAGMLASEEINGCGDLEQLRKLAIRFNNRVGRVYFESSALLTAVGVMLSVPWILDACCAAMGTREAHEIKDTRVSETLLPPSPSSSSLAPSPSPSPSPSPDNYVNHTVQSVVDAVNSTLSAPAGVVAVTSAADTPLPTGLSPVWLKFFFSVFVVGASLFLWLKKSDASTVEASDNSQPKDSVDAGLPAKNPTAGSAPPHTVRSAVHFSRSDRAERCRLHQGWQPGVIKLIIGPRGFFARKGKGTALVAGEIGRLA
jgi:hypothetical protein